MRKNIKATDLRQALLDAGVDLLREQGIASALDRVTLQAVVERAGVPRSSAYALLAKNGENPLDALHRELLAYLDKNPAPDSTLAVVDEVFAEQAERLESGDPVELAIAFRELVRRGLDENVSRMADRVEWRVFMSSLLAATSGEHVDPAALEMHRESGANYSGSFVNTYRAVFNLFGIRVVAPMTVENFAAAAASSLDGIAVRMEIDPSLVGIERPTGPDGELQTWHSGAILFEGMLLSWTEPDPNAAVSADLSTWTRHG